MVAPTFLTVGRKGGSQGDMKVLTGKEMSARDFINHTIFMRDDGSGISGQLPKLKSTRVTYSHDSLSGSTWQNVWHTHHIQRVIVCAIHYLPRNELGRTEGRP